MIKGRKLTEEFVHGVFDVGVSGLLPGIIFSAYSIMEVQALTGAEVGGSTPPRHIRKDASRVATLPYVRMARG